MVTMAICMVILLGALGMVFDLGRGFITKNEAQAFTDSAALAAALRLNATSTGITAAKAAVTSDANKWLMNTKSFTSVRTEFSPDKITWETNPTNPANVRFVKVTAPSNNVTMHFLTTLGMPGRVNATAMSVAGYQLPTTFPQGVFPFAPIAKTNVKPNFGYGYGDILTLLWPSSVGSNGQGVKMNNLCLADRNQASLDAVKAGTTSDRGYIQESSADAIAEAIEDDKMDYTVSLDQAVYRSGGVKSTDVAQSLADRVAQDAFPDESDYPTYLARHATLNPARPMRRVVFVPIIDGAVTAVARGFVKVFLPPSQPKNPNDAKCAMYIGPADIPSGNTGSGANMVRLFQ